MKAKIIIGLAIVVMPTSAFAQGTKTLDDIMAKYGVKDDKQHLLWLSVKLSR